MDDELINEYDLVTAAEAEDILGVTRQRISQLRRAGLLVDPVYFNGKMTLWRRADIEAWADEHGYTASY